MMENDITALVLPILEDNAEVHGRDKKIQILVDALRLASNDSDIKASSLIIPNACEKYGFAEGSHNLSVLLHFLADMLEE